MRVSGMSGTSAPPQRATSAHARRASASQRGGGGARAAPPARAASAFAHETHEFQPRKAVRHARTRSAGESPSRERASRVAAARSASAAVWRRDERALAPLRPAGGRGETQAVGRVGQSSGNANTPQAASAQHRQVSAPSGAARLFRGSLRALGARGRHKKGGRRRAQKDAAASNERACASVCARGSPAPLFPSHALLS